MKNTASNKTYLYSFDKWPCVHHIRAYFRLMLQQLKYLFLKETRFDTCYSIIAFSPWRVVETFLTYVEIATTLNISLRKRDLTPAKQLSLYYLHITAPVFISFRKLNTIWHQLRNTRCVVSIKLHFTLPSASLHFQPGVITPLLQEMIFSTKEVLLLLLCCSFAFDDVKGNLPFCLAFIKPSSECGEFYLSCFYFIINDNIERTV